MKKLTILSLIFLFSGVLTGFSRPVSPEEALIRLTSTPFSPGTRGSDNKLELKYTYKDKDDIASLYIFDNSESGGYLVMSADDSAYPVLGYSDKGSFDPANIAPQLSFWLNQYMNQIEYMRSKNFPSMASEIPGSFADMEEIEPLLKSKWNQGAPYNEYCYTIASNGDETKSVTGCVATSMAQVMYYYKFPEIGHGSISYKHGDSGTYSMNFGERPFSWNEMLPTYYPDSYTEEQGEAVAYLMKACGYSVKMDYSKGEAGANGTEIASALIDYFGYNDAIQVETRAFFTYDDWAQMIYNNLKSVGPVVYNGSALDGGHSFVCDGYDGNGYFHFNWGWGGMSDGYYILDALNPDEFGIGGAAGGYNLGQQVILNISPKEIEASIPQLMQFGNPEGKITDGILSLKLSNASDPGLQYINPLQIKLTLGIKVVNLDNPTQEVQYFKSDKANIDAHQGSFFKWKEYGTTINLSKVDMTEGDEYNFIISAEISSGTTEGWSEVVAMPGKSNYVTITKTSGGYVLKNHTVENINVSNFKILSSPIYYDMPVKFSATFTNESSQQLTRNYSAIFFNSTGEECFKMENYSITIDSLESNEITWSSVNWYKEDSATDVDKSTEFTVKLYDNWQGEYVEGIEETVTVMPKTSEAKVESELTIVDALKEGDVYVVTGNDLQVSLSVKVIEGFFNHTIMLALQAPLNDGDYYTIMHKHFDAIPDLSAGEEQVFEMSVTLDDIEPDKVYRVEVWGPGSGFNEKKLVKFDIDSESVENIIPDANGQYIIYNINGTLHSISTDPDFIKSLPHGIYIVNGRKLIIK